MANSKWSSEQFKITISNLANINRATGAKVKEGDTGSLQSMTAIGNSYEYTFNAAGLKSASSVTRKFSGYVTFPGGNSETISKTFYSFNELDSSTASISATCASVWSNSQDTTINTSLIATTGKPAHRLLAAITTSANTSAAGIGQVVNASTNSLGQATLTWKKNANTQLSTSAAYITGTWKSIAGEADNTAYSSANQNTIGTVNIVYVKNAVTSVYAPINIPEKLNAGSRVSLTFTTNNNVYSNKLTPVRANNSAVDFPNSNDISITGNNNVFTINVSTDLSDSANNLPFKFAALSKSGDNGATNVWSPTISITSCQLPSLSSSIPIDEGSEKVFTPNDVFNGIPFDTDISHIQINEGRDAITINFSTSGSSDETVCLHVSGKDVTANTPYEFIVKDIYGASQTIKGIIYALGVISPGNINKNDSVTVKPGIDNNGLAIDSATNCTATIVNNNVVITGTNFGVYEVVVKNSRNAKQTISGNVIQLAMSLA